MAAKRKLVLKGVRICYADGLFTAKQFPGSDGPPRYNCGFMLYPDHPQLDEVRQAITEVAQEEFKDKAASTMAQIKSNPNKCCFQSPEIKPQYDGAYYLGVNTKTRPDVRDRDGKTPLALADGRPYSGCYVNAIVEIWGQSGQYTGIRGGLLGVQFVEDGDSFSGGGVASEDDFEDLGDGADAPDIGEKASGSNLI